MKKFKQFLQKNECVILDAGKFDCKNSLYPCPTSKGRMVFLSVFKSEKNDLQIEKKSDNNCFAQKTNKKNV